MNLEPFSWDKSIFIKINELGQSSLDYLCGWPTHLGDPILLIFLTTSLLLIWDEKKTAQKIMLISFGTIAGCYIANWIKPCFFRLRPFLYYRELAEAGSYQPNTLFDLLISESSFPSGHTTTIFSCITVIVCIYGWRLWPLYLIGAFLGFTRMYVGAHFPSDIMAGALIGIGVGIVTHQLFARIFSAKR